MLFDVDLVRFLVFVDDLVLGLIWCWLVLGLLVTWVGVLYLLFRLLALRFGVVMWHLRVLAALWVGRCCLFRLTYCFVW